MEEDRSCTSQRCHLRRTPPAGTGFVDGESGLGAKECSGFWKLGKDSPVYSQQEHGDLSLPAANNLRNKEADSP